MMQLLQGAAIIVFFVASEVAVRWMYHFASDTTTSDEETQEPGKLSQRVSLQPLWLAVGVCLVALLQSTVRTWTVVVGLLL